MNREEETTHTIKEYRLDVLPPFSLNLARFLIFPRWISSLIARLTEDHCPLDRGAGKTQFFGNGIDGIPAFALLVGPVMEI